MVRLATGQGNIPAVIATAKAKSVTHFIIEDESPRVAAQLPESLKAVAPLIEGDLGPVSIDNGTEARVLLEETFDTSLSADWHWGLGTWTTNGGVLRGFESGERRHGPVKQRRLTITAPRCTF